MRSKILLLISTLFLIAQNAAAVSIGTIAIYSDGSARKLLAKGEGHLIWEDDRKRQFTVSDNPVMPVLELKHFLGDRGYQQRLKSGRPGEIHSLQDGTKVEFSVIRTRHTGKSSARNYGCVRLEGTRQKVLGEQRQLERYRCERFTYHRKAWTKQVKEKREFSYSPELGLVVDLSRQTSKRSSKKKLVALIAPDETSLKRVNRILRKVRARKK